MSIIIDISKLSLNNSSQLGNTYTRSKILPFHRVLTPLSNTFFPIVPPFYPILLLSIELLTTLSCIFCCYLKQIVIVLLCLNQLVCGYFVVELLRLNNSEGCGKTKTLHYVDELIFTFIGTYCSREWRWYLVSIIDTKVSKWDRLSVCLFFLVSCNLMPIKLAWNCASGHGRMKGLRIEKTLNKHVPFYVHI